MCINIASCIPNYTSKSETEQTVTNIWVIRGQKHWIKLTIEPVNAKPTCRFERKSRDDVVLHMMSDSSIYYSSLVFPYKLVVTGAYFTTQ